MKTILLHEPGGVDQLIHEEVKRPEVGKKEVLIKTHALSINPVDVKTRQGKGVFGRLKNDLPITIGWDVSGEIVAVGEEVTEFKVGDAVFGMVNFPGHGKAYAEYVAAPADHLALKPAEVSHSEAAAATLAALTAWQVLFQQGNLQAGQRVLVHAAAGGVGHVAVQLAKHAGAYVIGTASASKADFLREIGLDKHIDYTQVAFEEAAKDIDLVVDPVGGDTTRRSLNVLKKGGKLVSIVGGANEAVQSQANEQGVEALNYLVHSSGEDMKQLASLLQTGALKAHVSHTFDFDHLAEAHQQVESGKTWGKVVVTVG